MTFENVQIMNTLTKTKFIKVVVLSIGILLFMPACFGQGLFTVLPDTLIWSANDLTPKDFSIMCRRDWWQADVTASTGLYQFDMTEGYDMCIVSVTPLQANTSTYDRHIAVVFTRSSSGATTTLHLVQQGVPPPEPEPEPDPWLDDADDLATDRNWIQKTTVTAADGSSSYRDIEWYSGLGYRDQVTLVGASTEGKSIISPVVYDRMRRDDARSYLPYADNLPEGLYRTNAISRQAGYYANPSIYDESRPFSEKEYATSPVGRPMSWQREGDDWNAGGGHKIGFNYRVNLPSDSVWRYRIVPGANVASNAGMYPAGSLQCTETIGENGGTSRTFTDVLGRTVCVAQKTDDGQWARTLYIRDIRDSLTVVVQPEGVKALKSLTNKDISLLPGSGTNQGVSDAWCFIWKYDWRGNLLSEHIPGGGTVEYAYDSRNREVLRTDSRMSPASGGTYRMVWTIYDQYDRITSQMYASCNVPISTMRPLVGNGPSWTLPSSATSHLSPFRPLRTAEYFPFTSFSYPTTGSSAYVAESGFASSPETERVKGMLKRETLYGAPEVDGSLPTGTPYVARYYHYDSRGRVIQTNEGWSDNWSRRVSTGYTFTGEVQSVQETVTPPGGTSRVMNTQYTRDGRDRLLSCSRILDGQPLRTVLYSYDALGHLSAKQAGTGSFLKTSLQYDIHGWLNQITLTSGGATTVFQETLRYASPSRTSVTSRYDGNPAEITYLHKVSGGTDTHTWGYEYDMLGRVTNAAHFVGSSTTASLTDTEGDIVYNLNGNITRLKRYGASGLANDLSFVLSGNRMTALTDAQALGNDSGQKTFTYDANGNLTHDGRKDLDIQWNILNLASSAETHDDGSLTYARLSDGTLFAQQKVSGGSTTGKRYCGSFVFTTGTGITTPQVESIGWDEGRIFRDSQTGALQDCWFVGDHLGNVRSVLDITPDVTLPVPLEQNDYLPFGTKISNPLHDQMNTNRWRYAGKEEFPELNLLDFGARLYDPFTARWTAVDKEAGKIPNFGSFVYCGSNPISHKEVDGNIWDTAVDAAFLVADLGSAAYHLVKKDHQAAKESLKNAGVDLVFAIVPGATVAMAKGAKLLKNADRVAEAGKTAKNTVQSLSNMARGRETEQFMLKKLGLQKNTKTFVSKTNKGEFVRVIPDAVTENTIIEIKDVQKLSLTKQIQGEYNAAVSSGKTFELHVRQGAELSSPLKKMEELENFKIVEF